MTNPEQGGALEQKYLEKEHLTPAERAARARRTIEEARAESKNFNLGEGVALAAKLEALLTHAEENPETPQSEGIFEAFESYADAIDHYERMERLENNLREVDRALGDEAYNVGDKVSAMREDVAQGITVATSEIENAEIRLNQLIEKME